MRKSRKFISLPIISLEEGQKIGVIKDLIIDPIRKELAAILVEQRGWFKEQKIIPYSKVRSAGVDAITVEKSSSVDKAANFPGIMGLINDKITLIGARVITETGAIIGQVEEFWIDDLSGKIITLDITGNLFNSMLKGTGQLSVEYIRTIGTDVLVACEGAENLIITLDGGLQDRVKNLKDITSHLFTATWEKTKNIGKLVDDEYAKTATEHIDSVQANDKGSAAYEPQLPNQKNSEQLDQPQADLNQADLNQVDPNKVDLTKADLNHISEIELITEEAPCEKLLAETPPADDLSQPSLPEQDLPKVPPTLS